MKNISATNVVCFFVTWAILSYCSYYFYLQSLKDACGSNPFCILAEGPDYPTLLALSSIGVCGIVVTIVVGAFILLSNKK